MQILTLVYVTVLENVRAQIKARGAKTIRGLGRTFRNFDSFDGNHQIDREEFYSGLCEIQIRISRQEADALMALFDTNGDGYVNFDEFLVGIRVSHPSSRPLLQISKGLAPDRENCGVRGPHLRICKNLTKLLLLFARDP